MAGATPFNPNAASAAHARQRQMRAGGSNQKGNDWENEVCRLLSRWLTAGQKADLFTRNVQSGGRHTVALRRGKDPGSPGDVAAQHPAAWYFLENWFIEAKHYKDLEWHLALWRNSGFLYNFLEVAERQAVASGRHYMMVAKENRQPAICVVPHLPCIERVRGSSLVYHELWNQRSIAFRFDHLLLTSPEPWTS